MLPRLAQTTTTDNVHMPQNLLILSEMLTFDKQAERIKTVYVSLDLSNASSGLALRTATHLYINK